MSSFKEFVSAFYFVFQNEVSWQDLKPSDPKHITKLSQDLAEKLGKWS